MWSIQDKKKLQQAQREFKRRWPELVKKQKAKEKRLAKLNQYKPKHSYPY